MWQSKMVSSGTIRLIQLIFLWTSVCSCYNCALHMSFNHTVRTLWFLHYKCSWSIYCGSIDNLIFIMWIFILTTIVKFVDFLIWSLLWTLHIHFYGDSGNGIKFVSSDWSSLLYIWIVSVICCTLFFIFFFPSFKFMTIRKSHITCLNSQGAAYISVGQLQLVPIGFKLKSNNDICRVPPSWIFMWWYLYLMQ